MDRVFQALRPVIRAVVTHPILILLVAVVATLLGVQEAIKLRIDTDFANLIPKDYPSVQAIEHMRDTIGGESEVGVGIESSSFENNRAFAEALIPRAMGLRQPNGEPYFTRVDYRKDVTFLEDNALYFASSQELDELETYLDDKIEEAKLEANPFFFDLEDEEDEGAEGDTTAARLQEVYNDLVAKTYPISDDSLTMVLRFYPAGSQTNIGFIERVYADMDSLVAAIGPATFDPQMKVTLAGRLLRQLTEVEAIRKDVLRSFAAGVSTVLLMVILYFMTKAYRARAGRRFEPQVLMTEILRMPVMAVIIGLPLLMSLSWTFGVAYLAFTELNLMTSTLGLVLFGLGIDYGIHFYARYTEERASGLPVLDAAEETFASTGQAITVGAFTTAMALYVLVVADFKGFSEFGFIAGTGILFALVGMLIVLPALLGLMEKLGLLSFERINGDHRQKAGSRPIPGARGLVLASVAAVVAAILLVPRVSFQYDFGALEPTYEDYYQRQQVMSRVYDNSKRRNPAYIIVDNPDEVEPLVTAIRTKADADTLSPTIRMVESLQDRFPMKAEQQAVKLARIAAIRELLDDPFLKAEPSEDLDKLRQAAQTTAPIDLDQVPEFMRERFTTKTGELGTFVIIYPSVGLSDGRQSMAFADDVGTITMADGTVYHAGSTSLVAADMLRLMLQEAPWMVLATFSLVVLLMWFNFRTLRWTMLALLPLVVGVLWMLLIMELVDLKLTFYNLIVLPAVLGIGNDAGVHLVHRYREEGRRSIWYVLRTTGEHVTMGSTTTMVGFAGLLLSFHPGIEGIGQLAVVGIGATLLAALIFLPALLQWLEDREEMPEPEVVQEAEAIS